MAHSSQRLYVVEDNESQLWNHVILWFRIIDGTVARPLAEVAWVWHKSGGSLSGLLQKSFFFPLKNWYKSIFLNISICETRNFLKKRVQSINSYSLFLFCVEGKRYPWHKVGNAFENVCFEQENVLGLQGKVLGWLLWGAAGGFPCIWWRQCQPAPRQTRLRPRPSPAVAVVAPLG